MTVGPHQQSPFHIELSPWCTDQTLERSLLLRGAYIAAVGQIETHLTEWAIRSSRSEEYAGLRTTFPRHRNERITYLRDLTAKPGPLAAFADPILKTVDAYEALNDLRDILAHGSMSVMAMRGIAGGAGLKFRDFFGKAKSAEFRGTTMSMLQLENAAIQATEAARNALSLHHKVDQVLPTM